MKARPGLNVDTLNPVTRYALELVLNQYEQSSSSVADRHAALYNRTTSHGTPFIDVNARNLANLLWALHDVGLIVDD